ncbi:MAG: hypothetical protein RI985_2110 [Chloroflexota bacterium]
MIGSMIDQRRVEFHSIVRICTINGYELRDGTTIHPFDSRDIAGSTNQRDVLLGIMWLTRVVERHRGYGECPIGDGRQEHITIDGLACIKFESGTQCIE